MDKFIKEKEKNYTKRDYVAHLQRHLQHLNTIKYHHSDLRELEISQRLREVCNCMYCQVRDD